MVLVLCLIQLSLLDLPVKQYLKLYRKKQENDRKDFERAQGINDPNYFTNAEDIVYDGVNVQVNNTNISKFVSKLTKAQATALERASR